MSHIPYVTTIALPDGSSYIAISIKGEWARLTTKEAHDLGDKLRETAKNIDYDNHQEETQP